MRYVTLLSCLLLFLVTGFSPAQPALSPDDLDTESYLQWLQEKEALWTDEISRLEAFAPDRVAEMRETLGRLQETSERLRSSGSPDLQQELKRETNVLAFSLEKQLESALVALERASGPAIVLDI